MRPINYLRRGWVFRLDEPYVNICPRLLSFATKEELFEHFFSKNPDDIEEFLDRLMFRIDAFWKNCKWPVNPELLTTEIGNARANLRHEFNQARDILHEFVNNFVDDYRASDRAVFGKFITEVDFFLEEIEPNT